MEKKLTRRSAIGDVSGLRGDVTGLRGDISECRLTPEERIAGVPIERLIKEE